MKQPFARSQVSLLPLVAGALVIASVGLGFAVFYNVHNSSPQTSLSDAKTTLAFFLGSAPPGKPD
jgi:hypothetical protein